MEINRRAEGARRGNDSKALKLHDLDSAADDESSAPILKVRGLTHPLDKIADTARQATEGSYRVRLEQLIKGPPAVARIAKRGKSSVIAKVTKQLAARGLEDSARLVLAIPAVYEILLINALDKEGVGPDDDQGLADALLRSLGEPRRFLLEEIVGSVLDNEGIELDKEELHSLHDLAAKCPPSLRVGAVRADVLKLVDEARRIGGLRTFVDWYGAKGGIDAALVTEDVKREMARFLHTRGLRIADNAAGRKAFDAGTYDEHFAIAFDHARGVAEGRDDPVDMAQVRGSVADWDFTIRRIRESDRPIIRAQAIRAAGALYTTFVEGEQMRVFDIVDTLVTNWHRGELDIPDGETAALLNRYEILMRDRPTEEERQMLYKRVFNIGEVEMRSGTVVNDAFPGLWDNLMYEVTRYIDKTERYAVEEESVSRTALYQAIRDLQYNLSEYMTGSTTKETTEIYRHLEEALDIIGSEDVLNHLGGRRKSILTVIERMGEASLGIAIPATSLVTIAERGKDVFGFIADFAAENVTDDELERFLDACRACIVSQVALGQRHDEGDFDD